MNVLFKSPFHITDYFAFSSLNFQENCFPVLVVQLWFFRLSFQIKHTLERLHEPAGEAIVKAAEEHNVDFIVVGSRGLGTIRRTIMGSVSDYIVHHAYVPVLICKHTDQN